MSPPYRPCLHCGAHLDPGESCDCKRENAAAPPPLPELTTAYIRETETARLSPNGGKKKAADA